MNQFKNKVVPKFKEFDNSNLKQIQHRHCESSEQCNDIRECEKCIFDEANIHHFQKWLHRKEA